MLVAPPFTVPALLVLVGVSTALFGVAPRFAPGAWAALAVVAVITFFGDALGLPEWVQSLSPLEHLPRAPGEDVDLAPLVRSEEHTSELQSLMRISYAVFCLKKNNKKTNTAVD